MSRVASITLLLLALCLAGAVASQPSGSTFALTLAPNRQSDPVVSGNIVVWEDYRDYSTNGSDIYGYNLTERRELTICTAPGDQTLPYVAGDIVAWQDARNGETTDIYAYNLKSEQEFVVCNSPGAQTQPVVSQAFVAWADNRNYDQTGTDIYARNIQTSEVFPVCTAPGMQTTVDLDGNIAVWEDNRNTVTEGNPHGTGDTDIYAANLATREEIIVCTANGAQSMPVVAGDIIAWIDYRNDPDLKGNTGEDTGVNNGDVYAYSISDKKEIAVCTLPQDAFDPILSGSILMWEDWRNDPRGGADWDNPTGNENSDVFAYDFDTNQAFAVTTAEKCQSPAGSSDSLFAWFDFRNDPGDRSNCDVYGRLRNDPAEFPISTAPAWQHGSTFLANRSYVSGPYVIWMDDRNKDPEHDMLQPIANLDIYGFKLEPQGDD